jgi:lactate permease
MAALILFLRFWRPAKLWTSPVLRVRDDSAATMPAPKALPEVNRDQIVAAWMPWLILCVVVGICATDPFKRFVNALFAPAFPIEGLHNLVQKVPPVVAAPAAEAAVFTFTFLSYTGTGILVAAIIAALYMRFPLARIARAYGETLLVVRFSLITIAAMLSLGTLTRFSGIDATLGLSFAQTGVLYPFFGTLLGWLGVALTGSDTASNVLFGGLQRVTSEQLGVSGILMGAANSSGGVMGKMIDAQSIVVASTATGWFGHESSILRFVFFHSIVLASLVGVLVMLQAYVWPFTEMVIHP